MKAITKYIVIAFVCAVSLSFYACKDEYPTFPYPDWKVNPANDYSVSMTAVVKLPKTFRPNFNPKDQLAAFVGEECRGVGTFMRDSLFFVSIQGTPNEQSSIHFALYSTFNGYIYKTDDFLIFEPNITYDTIDDPKEIILKKITK